VTGNNHKQLTDSPFQESGDDCLPDGKWVVPYHLNDGCTR